MPPISTKRYSTEILSSTGTFAGLVDGADLTRQVPTCPDWTLRQLTTHLGRAQRWAAEIVGTRSATSIPFREVPYGRLPDDPAQHAQWLRAGSERLTAALAEAGSDTVWTFAGTGPASLWARRMAHETAVHRADAELAAGREPAFEPDLAADAIDEWLVLCGPAPGDEDPRLGALPEGAVLHIHATDDALAAGADAPGPGEWLIRREGPGITVQHGHGKGDVAVRGPTGQLLLVLLRRLPPETAEVQILGDSGLLTAWLAATPF